jgi:RNA polymerase sigma factor (sigma-70 family)
VTTISRGQRQFDTTSWSLVLAASETGSEDAASALADFCARYWSPVYAFVRSKGYSADDAEDLTQGFFARLLEKNYVAQAERSRERFRTFLLAAVKHFLANEYDRRFAQKRGGQSEHLSIDSDSAAGAIDPAGPLTPEQLYDKRWALSVVERVLAEVRAEAVAEGRGEQLERLLPLILGDAPRRSYAEIAAETGISEGTLRVAVHRQRLRFREQLRRTIAATVVQPHEIDEEIRFLINAVSPTGAGSERVQ